MSDATHILSAIDAGDPQAAVQLLPLVNDELRRLAAAQMAYENPVHTLDATGIRQAILAARPKLVFFCVMWRSGGVN